MMILAYDTETSGLVDSRLPPQHDGQPHLVQLSAVAADETTGREVATLALVIRPDGWTIPAQAASVHGITTELAGAVGVPLVVALASLNWLFKAATVHVAHNDEFDVSILTTAFWRVRRELPPLNRRCTQALLTPVMNLPPSERMRAAGFDRPKPPRLAEAVRYLFNEDLPGAHDALVDARACLRCYLELRRRGITQ